MASFESWVKISRPTKNFISSSRKSLFEKHEHTVKTPLYATKAVFESYS